MENFLINGLMVFILLAYCYSVIIVAVDGCEHWWEPIVMGALIPFYAIYKNLANIAAVSAIFLIVLSAFILFSNFMRLVERWFA